MRYIIMKIVILLLCFSSCIDMGAGTLGGWEMVEFSSPEEEIQNAIDSLYRAHPEYVLPEKWEYKTKSWIDTYSFLKTVILYFKDYPEEMYYVTFVGAGLGDNPNHTRLAVRAVETDKTTWKKHEELSEEEQERIQKRFKDEIILKLEEIIQKRALEKK